MKRLKDPRVDILDEDDFREHQQDQPQSRRPHDPAPALADDEWQHDGGDDGIELDGAEDDRRVLARGNRSRKMTPISALWDANVLRNG